MLQGKDDPYISLIAASYDGLLPHHYQILMEFQSVYV